MHILVAKLDTRLLSSKEMDRIFSSYLCILSIICGRVEMNMVIYSG